MDIRVKGPLALAVVPEERLEQVSAAGAERASAGRRRRVVRRECIFGSSTGKFGGFSLLFESEFL